MFVPRRKWDSRVYWCLQIGTAVFGSFVIESQWQQLNLSHGRSKMMLIFAFQQRTLDWASTYGTYPWRLTLLTIFGSVHPSQYPYEVSRSWSWHSVDHGHLRCLSSFLLLCQDIHSSLLSTSFSAASEATIYHLRSHGLLHSLLLGRVLHRNRPLQREEPAMGYHCDNELFRLRQAYICDRRPGSRCWCHHPRVSNTNGGELTYLVATEDILAICLFGRFDVSSSLVWSKRPGFDAYLPVSASIACAIRVAFAVQSRGTTDATFAQYRVVTLLWVAAPLLT